jgi:hypothetical protein
VDAEGRFSFTGWNPGHFDLRCLPLEGVTYTPASMSIGVTAAGRSDLVLRGTGAATPTFSISGTVTADGAPLAGVVVGTGSNVVTTGADGGYSITGLHAGVYTVTATRSGYTFEPASRSATVGPDAAGVDFAARTSTRDPVVSGRVLGDFAGTRLRLASTGTPWQQTVTVDAEGRFSFTGWNPGHFDLRCLPLEGVTYTPASMSIGVTAAGRSDLVFRARRTTTTALRRGAATGNGEPTGEATGGAASRASAGKSARSRAVARGSIRRSSPAWRRAAYRRR